MRSIAARNTISSFIVLIASLVLFGCEPTAETEPTAEVETPEAQAEATEAQGIVGTYRLVSRDLADGTIVTPPQAEGLLTYTEKYRNFNVHWTDQENRHFSLAYIAEYELTETTYTETNIYRLLVDEISGIGASYESSPESGSSSVTREDGAMSFDLPLWDEPSVRFTDSGFTATREGEFVDHWERVE